MVYFKGSEWQVIQEYRQGSVVVSPVWREWVSDMTQCERDGTDF